jgi:hypothetical protein
MPKPPTRQRNTPLPVNLNASFIDAWLEEAYTAEEELLQQHAEGGVSASDAETVWRIYTPDDVKLLLGM